ncbi:MAG: tRNA (uridine(34)/cytosine(34)/5-carboxymethylaminomethyluridine(34)-2'-O)-methyltransferase TrmL [Bacilli bacterium]|nr:tRNA (uridine(34)/cytosine(34)/5-carboxymethylaminomethyluridine(34)-2'-O)-methyltransferase TrmL [Bacilli bacterium]
MPHLNIVLLEPEIPQNTGNIARTCAATGASLHLIKPLGFSLDDKHMKRAGLDYWSSLDLHVYENIEEFYSLNKGAEVYYFSKKGRHLYANITFPDDVYLMFGKESVGLPESLLNEHEEHCLRMPMKEGLRSLNLSNTVAIAAYEVLRQQGFPGLEIEGHLGER